MDYRVEAGKIAISSILVFLLDIIQSDTSFRLLTCLIGLIIFDTILGSAKAIKAGEWKTSKARWGSIGKLFQLGFITIAYLLGWALDYNAIGYWFIVYFCLVELGSILENGYELGIPIPKGLVEIATKSKHFIGYFFIEKIKVVIQAVTNMDYEELDKKVNNTNRNKND